MQARQSRLAAPAGRWGTPCSHVGWRATDGDAILRKGNEGERRAHRRHASCAHTARSIACTTIAMATVVGVWPLKRLRYTGDRIQLRIARPLDCPAAGTQHLHRQRQRIALHAQGCMPEGNFPSSPRIRELKAAAGAAATGSRQDVQRVQHRVQCVAYDGSGGRAGRCAAVTVASCGRHATRRCSGTSGADA